MSLSVAIGAHPLSAHESFCDRRMRAACHRHDPLKFAQVTTDTPGAMFGPSRKPLVGLDIESGYIAAVEAEQGSVSVSRAAVVPLAPGVVRDGEVVDAAALTAALRQLFAEHKLGKNVRVGLANQRVVMRTIDLPPLTDPKQIASAVQFQAQDQIPMPLEQAVWEHQSLGLVGTADGPRARVALVAARREMVEEIIRAVQDAGLKPAGVDLSAFALIRALYRAGDPDEPTAYLNIGNITNLAVAAGTQCLFTRVIPTGSEQMVTELSGRRGLTSEHAAGWLRHVGLVTPVEQLEGDTGIVETSRAVLFAGAARIADEVRTTLNFYAAQENGVVATRAIISGPAVAIPGLVDAIGARLGIPVETRTVDVADGVDLAGAGIGQLSVAAGLTAEEIAL